jgi:hypothetical protein
MAYIKHSLITKVSLTNGMKTMTNYGLEVIFWVILGVVLIYQYEEGKKK